MGPKARDVLSAVTESDVGNAAFPFGQHRELMIAGTPVRALRVTYVGELGWELHVPMDSLASVYDALMKAGAPHGIRNAGYRAIESLRLEKFYRAWSSDISPDHSPLEAGMGWAVKLKKNVPFLGREALSKLAAEAAQAAGLLHDRRSVDRALGPRDHFPQRQAMAGSLSGGYGYTLETNIGIGYVRDKENGVTPEDAFRHLGRRSPASATRPRSAWTRSTTRRWRGSRRSCRPPPPTTGEGRRGSRAFGVGQSSLSSPRPTRPQVGGGGMNSASGQAVAIWAQIGPWPTRFRTTSDTTMLDMLQIIWGEGYLSPGGPQAVREIVAGIDLAGSVLDIGCGIGGLDQVLALGAAHVTAVDGGADDRAGAPPHRRSVHRVRGDRAGKASAVRRRQLRRGLHQGRLAACARQAGVAAGGASRAEAGRQARRWRLDERA
jgi:hypothetical protein